MKLVTTPVFDANIEAYQRGKRRALNEGGTASSKTWSVLQLLVLLASEAKERLLISVVSESLPHLKRGCIRDFINIMDDMFEDSRYNKSEQTYNFGDGVIEFFGADEAGKVRGPRRDILFINEGNNIPWETARGLDIRTSKFTFVDWNPVSEFWAHENWIGKDENTYIHSTYQDAKNILPQEVIDNIESNRYDPNWWNIYGLGLIGKVEALVYPRFEQVDKLPQGDVVYGLDFGFLTDPTVLVKNVIIGDSVFSEQLLYDRSGLTNDAIARQMDLLGVKRRNDLIYADPSEPKSIQEIYDADFNIRPSVKGPGSVEYGHQKTNQYKQHWTKDSLDCIKEQRNFRYIKDKDEKLTEKTTHQWSHSMDARRYALAGHESLAPRVVQVTNRSRR